MPGAADRDAVAAITSAFAGEHIVVEEIFAHACVGGADALGDLAAGLARSLTLLHRALAEHRPDAHPVRGLRPVAEEGSDSDHADLVVLWWQSCDLVGFEMLIEDLHGRRRHLEVLWILVTGAVAALACITGAGGDPAATLRELGLQIALLS